MSRTHIKCPKCNTFSSSDHCEKCGLLINPKLIRQAEIVRRKNAYLKTLIKLDKEEQDTWLYHMMNHKWLVIRLIGYVLNAIWFVVMAVGGFLAWLAATISA